MEPSGEPHARLKKRPHTLYRCADVDELVEELRAEDIDLVALVYEFVKPSVPVGILVTGSIANGVATPVSDMDVVVLVPDAKALKARKREVWGEPVNYLPTGSSVETEVSTFLRGIELDVIFLVNPAVDDPAARAAERPSDSEEEEHSIASRLASGWVVHGHEVVERWKEHYGADDIRIKWIAAKFTEGTKLLEDMHAGIGLGRGHVACVGSYVVECLVSALLADHGYYASSANWMLKLNRMLPAVDPEVREALETGAELAFPALPSGVDAEREYFERVYEYACLVRDVLSREEGMADVFASIIYDLDIILPAQPTS
jgi:hypothetical protein